MKPSDALLDAVARVEGGYWGLYSSSLNLGADGFIDAVMPGDNCTWPKSQAHRATILAMAYALAKDAGK